MIGLNTPKSSTSLSASQQHVVSFPRQGGASLLVRGLPGTGKTQALISRVAAMLSEGRRPYEILVLVPQRDAVPRYTRALALLDAPTRGGVDIVTYYGLSRRAVSLFWSAIAAQAGFSQPDEEPTFLTVETAQYYMWQIVDPLMRHEGYFADVVVPVERLLSQLLDNLNKSALVGFPHTEIYGRLKAAWTGSSDRLVRFAQAQECATRFRALCLERNLLDLSLTTEVFDHHLRPLGEFQRHLRARYRHLIADNIEDNVPVAHDLIRWLLPRCQSTVLAIDDFGGHRLLLGADPVGAEALGRECSQTVTCALEDGPTRDFLAFVGGVARTLQPAVAPLGAGGVAARARIVAGGGERQVWISMVRWACDRVAECVRQGTPPGRIAIVAPYVSEVMRTAVQEELALRKIGMRLLRPATTWRDEILVRGILVLLWLCHPDWEIEIRGRRIGLSEEDVSLALGVALADLDPIRSRLLARAVAGPGRQLLALSAEDAPKANIAPAQIWERVGYHIRQPYEVLRSWIEAYRSGPRQLPHVVLSRLFGDVLSLPGFGLHRQTESARAYGRLVESLAKFHEGLAPQLLDPDTIAREYLGLLLSGITSAEYAGDWPPADMADAVVLAPAYAYVTRDLRSDVQVWLDLGSDGWLDRPNQPLTHPHVLSRRWPIGQPWRDIEEEATRREALIRLLAGLAARCSSTLYLAFSNLGIDGREERGKLQIVLSSALARLNPFPAEG